MSEILFLAHRAPFPPDRGDRIRSYHVLRHLAARATVHLVAFADTGEEAVVPAAFRSMLGECVVVPRTKSVARAGLEALASGRPLSLAAFADRGIAAAVTDIISRRPVGCIYAYSGQMAQYLPVPGESDARTIMDFVDADSLKFGDYAAAARGPMRWAHAREARLLGAYERAVAARVDTALFVSAAEAALVPGGRVLENGIDTAFFDPAATVAPVAAGQGPLIVFTGQMDYRPNIAAVTWFAQTVLPSLRRRHPDLRFAIVGRAPTPAVRALAGEGVIVTGEVPDVRGWLAAAAVVVAPLAIARGIQNKVLEAMAMARPVVASTGAATGIDHEGTIRVADGPDDTVAAIDRLLADPADAAALGVAARARAVARYGWEARLAPLDAMAGLVPQVVAA